MYNKSRYYDSRYRNDNDYYRRRYYQNYRYPYSIYDSQIASNNQSIYNYGYMSDIEQISIINQIAGRRRYLY